MGIEEMEKICSRESFKSIGLVWLVQVHTPDFSWTKYYTFNINVHEKFHVWINKEWLLKFKQLSRKFQLWNSFDSDETSDKIIIMYFATSWFVLPQTEFHVTSASTV